MGVGIGSAGPFAILAAYSGQFARFGQLPGLARDSDAPEIRLTGMADHQYSLSRTTSDRSTCDPGTAAAWAANGDTRERKPIATGADAAFVVARVASESDGLRMLATITECGAADCCSR